MSKMNHFKKSVLRLIVGLAVISLQSCLDKSVSPDKLILPEATTTGKNTFGCIVNGKVWRDNGTSCFKCGPNPYAAASFYDVVITARNAYKDQIAQNFDFTYWSEDEPIKLNVEIPISSPNVTMRFWDEMNNCVIRSDENTEGFILFTKLDRDEKIISGQFEAKLSDTCNILVITEGRFDIKFY